MNWTPIIRDEFARLGKRVDASVVEELAQHAADAWEAARAEGDAREGHIVSMVMKQGTAMTMCGLAIGLGLAAATVRYLAAYLFGLEPFDLATFATVTLGLLFVAMVACAIPARRAARVDAIEALRH